MRRSRRYGPARRPASPCEVLRGHHPARAEPDIEAVYRRLAKRSPIAADMWMEGVLAAIDSLEEMPDRCSLAPETTFFGWEVRQFLFRKYRLLFTIEERHVRVITVRHASRKPLRRPPKE